MALNQTITNQIKCPFCGVEYYSRVDHYGDKDTPFRTHFMCECKNNHRFSFNITHGGGIFISGAKLIPTKEQEQLIYSEYINSDEWKNKSREEKIRTGYRCALCGKSGDDHTLNTHHNTYSHLGDERPGELVVLCEDCHKKFHRKDE